MASYRFGNISTDTVPASTLTRMRFREGPLNLSWKHCTMTSDFIAEMVAVPYRANRVQYRQVRHDVSYLANELIENTVKFRAPGDVLLEVLVATGSIRIVIANAIERETGMHFRGVLGKLEQDEPGVLLLERIEQNAATGSHAGSGLGILTLMSDYGAEFEWSFDEQPGGYDHLTTTATIALPMP
jgi:hypothetical protein